MIWNTWKSLWTTVSLQILEWHDKLMRHMFFFANPVNMRMTFWQLSTQSQTFTQLWISYLFILCGVYIYMYACTKSPPISLCFQVHEGVYVVSESLPTVPKWDLPDNFLGGLHLFSSQNVQKHLQTAVKQLHNSVEYHVCLSWPTTGCFIIEVCLKTLIGFWTACSMYSLDSLHNLLWIAFISIYWSTDLQPTNYGHGGNLNDCIISTTV